MQAVNKETPGSQGRKKSNVLDIILEMKDKIISFNLNKEELASLWENGIGTKSSDKG